MASWINETIDDGGHIGQFNSIALDASGYPHIGYYDENSDDLKYTYQFTVYQREGRNRWL